MNNNTAIVILVVWFCVFGTMTYGTPDLLDYLVGRECEKGDLGVKND